MYVRTFKGGNSHTILINIWPCLSFRAWRGKDVVMSYDNKIRIIGGSFKGRLLDVIDMEGLRPTTNRVRETVFNWLQDKVSGAQVLDLFAGSGALGLEALSRGANKVTLVEKDRDNAAILKNEIATLPGDNSSKVELICSDGLEYLKSLPNQASFDLIFLDPPFSSDLLESAVELIVSRDLLKDEGVVYVEMGSAKKKPLFGLSMIRDEQIGKCHFGLYEKSFFL